MGDIESIFGELLFAVRLINIPEEFANSVITEIRKCDGLKAVRSRYSGTHRIGTAEFLINEHPMFYNDNKYYRHLATVLCAGLNQAFGIYGGMLNPPGLCRSMLLDRMLDFDIFNCMSARLRAIEDKKVFDAKNDIIHDEHMSEKFNKLLGYMVRDRYNVVEFTASGYNSNTGILESRFNTIDGLIDMLDIEQFLDTNNLFTRKE